MKESVKDRRDTFETESRDLDGSRHVAGDRGHGAWNEKWKPRSTTRRNIAAVLGAVEARDGDVVRMFNRLMQRRSRVREIHEPCNIALILPSAYSAVKLLYD